MSRRLSLQWPHNRLPIPSLRNRRPHDRHLRFDVADMARGRAGRFVGRFFLQRSILRVTDPVLRFNAFAMTLTGVPRANNRSSC